MNLTPTHSSDDHSTLFADDAADAKPSNQAVEAHVTISAKKPSTPPCNRNTKADFIKIGCLNVRSLYPKIDQVQNVIEENDFDILGINETWLDNFISDQELLLNQYNLLRCDRNRHGGGVCVFIKQAIRYTLLKTVENSVESIWLKLNARGHSVGLGCIYRPPNSSQKYYDSILDEIEQVKNEVDYIIMMGDFNYNYKSDVASCPIRFIEAAYGLKQLITQPTRVTVNASSLLDIILTSIPERHESAAVLPIALSDHYLVYTTVRIKARQSNTKHNAVTFRDYKKFEADRFLHDLSLNAVINKTTSPGTLLEDWDSFKRTFIEVSDKHAPMVTRRLKQRSNPWITNEISQLMYQRDNAKRKLDRKKTPALANHYRQLRNTVTKTIRQAKRTFYENELSKVANNPRESWRLINKLTGNDFKTAPPNDISAQEFNEHFSQIGMKTVKDVPHVINPPWKGPVSDRKFKMEKIMISSIEKRLRDLGDKSSSDAIGMDSKLLCISARVLAPILASFFNASLESSVIPNDWKIARVTPVYKGKGDRMDKSNYRPISVLSHIAKILEREVQSRLLTYLVENEYIALDQSAYRPYHGTHTSLQRVINDWLDVVSDDMYIGVCLLDISKCFDTIDHGILCKKLQYYGIIDHEYAFFKSYLSNRSQFVSCNKMISSVSDITLGVPQGSVLGPILFLLYVNDVSQHVYLGKANIYADDTLIYYTGSTIKEIENVLQKCLDSVFEWYQGNRLVINPKKCVSMLVSGPNNQLNESLSVSLHGNQISQASSTTYLGLEISESLRWDDHVNKLCSQLSFKISKLARIRAFTPRQTLRQIYFSGIQTTIDYAITVWGYTTLENVHRIQRLQNFAGRILANDFDYVNHRGVDILKNMKIMNISQRIAYLSLILMFKCIHSLAPDYLCNEIVMAIEISERQTRFNDANNVYLPFTRKEFVKNSFLHKAGSMWNNLPNDFKNISSLSSFKLHLRNYVLTKF